MIRRLKRLVWQSLAALDRLALPLASRGRRLAAAWYGILSPRFAREQRAVLAGRLAHEHHMRAAQRSSPRLRRNIHRLEKGLVMRNRRAVFAEDYIGETVEALLGAECHGALDPIEHKWATDVLDAYFAVVGDSRPVRAARERYAARSPTAVLPAAAASDDAAAAAGTSWQPYARAQGVRAELGYDAFLQLCRQRRSVRWFLPRPVPRELIEKAVAAAAQAPSACNRQPLFFRCFERPEEARRVAGIPMGTAGYAENVPALIVVLGDLSAFSDERDRHLIYIDGALAAMQLMLALETLGLASCPVNWPDIEPLERRMARELKLPPHLRPVMLIAIGYPDPAGGVAHSAKKPVAALLRLDDDYAP